MKKTITEIAKEAIEYSPGWGIKAKDLFRIAEKYAIKPMDIFKEMVKLAN